MQNRTLVVSRYNEDINWLTKIHTWNIAAFNKGEPVEGNFSFKQLPNVGRESETYLNYIITNYDNLNDFTGFIQGNPFDHFEGCAADTSHIINYINTIKITQDFTFFGDHDLHECDHTGRPHHPGLNLYEYANYIKIDIPQIIRFRAGAQFIVSRERIIKNSKEFYCNILRTVNTEISPIQGFLLERLWQYIF